MDMLATDASIYRAIALICASKERYFIFRSIVRLFRQMKTIDPSCNEFNFAGAHCVTQHFNVAEGKSFDWLRAWAQYINTNLRGSVHYTRLIQPILLVINMI